MTDITDPQPSFQARRGVGGQQPRRLRGRANGLVRKPEGTKSFSGYDVMGWWQRLGKRQSVQSHSLPTQQRPVWIAQSHQEPGRVWRVHHNPSTHSPSLKPIRRAQQEGETSSCVVLLQRFNSEMKHTRINV